MKYVDGFLAAVPKANKDAYLKQAKFAAEIFKEYGASRVVECWADDMPEGEVTSFPKAVHLKDDEAVCFSWIEYPDKESRDACQKAVRSDPRFANMDMSSMPFDGQRMIFGSFAPIMDE